MIWLLILGCAIGFFFLMRWVFVWDQPNFNALTEDAIRGFMAGRTQPEEAPLSSLMKFNADLATDLFEAWTHCPSCGEFDCHAMREPLPWDPADWRAWSRGRADWLERHQSTTTITVWNGYSSRAVDRTPEYPVTEPVNETRFATIRICKCGKEWGQK